MSKSAKIGILSGLILLTSFPGWSQGRESQTSDRMANCELKQTKIDSVGRKTSGAAKFFSVPVSAGISIYQASIGSAVARLVHNSGKPFIAEEIVGTRE